MNEFSGTLLPDGFKARIPEVGTLKIGDAKRTGDRIVPQKLDHFRVCGPQPTSDGIYPDHPDFAAYNASHSRQLKIELLSDNPELNLEVARVLGGRGSLVCRGNGREAWRRQHPDGRVNTVAEFSRLKDGECGDHCPFAKDRRCKMATTLRFAIPGHTPIGACWKFRSTSWNTMQDLIGSMQRLRVMTDGILAGLPLTLYMTEQVRSYIANGAKSRSTFWTLAVGYMGSEMDLLADLNRVHETRSLYAKLGRRSDSLDAAIIAEQSLGVMGDVASNSDVEAAFALEYFPDPLVAHPTATTHDWSEEEIAEATASLYTYADVLTSDGVHDDVIAKFVSRYKSQIGSPDCAYETVLNRMATSAASKGGCND
jgi:hypothetical protein